MTLMLSAIPILLPVMVYALHRCGWHLSSPSHSCASIHPSCWIKQEKRIEVEFWRGIASAATVVFLVDVLAIVIFLVAPVAL